MEQNMRSNVHRGDGPSAHQTKNASSQEISSSISPQRASTTLLVGSRSGLSETSQFNLEISRVAEEKLQSAEMIQKQGKGDSENEDKDNEDYNGSPDVRITRDEHCVGGGIFARAREPHCRERASASSRSTDSFNSSLMQQPYTMFDLGNLSSEPKSPPDSAFLENSYQSSGPYCSPAPAGLYFKQSAYSPPLVPAGVSLPTFVRPDSVLSEDPLGLDTLSPIDSHFVAGTVASVIPCVTSRASSLETTVSTPWPIEEKVGVVFSHRTQKTGKLDYPVIISKQANSKMYEDWFFSQLYKPYYNVHRKSPSLLTIYAPADPLCRDIITTEEEELSFLVALARFLQHNQIVKYLGVYEAQQDTKFWNYNKTALHSSLKGWRGVAWSEIAAGLVRDQDDDEEEKRPKFWDTSKMTYKFIQAVCKKYHTKARPAILDPTAPWPFHAGGKITAAGILKDIDKYARNPERIQAEIWRDYVSKDRWDALAERLARDRGSIYQLFVCQLDKRVREYGQKLEREISKVEIIYFTWECIQKEQAGKSCPCRGRGKRADHGDWTNLFEHGVLTPRPSWLIGPNGKAKLPYTQKYFNDNYPHELRQAIRKLHHPKCVPQLPREQLSIHKEDMFIFEDKDPKTRPGRPRKYPKENLDMPEWGETNAVEAPGILDEHIGKRKRAPSVAPARSLPRIPILPPASVLRLNQILARSGEKPRNMFGEELDADLESESFHDEKGSSSDQEDEVEPVEEAGETLSEAETLFEEGNDEHEAWYREQYELFGDKFRDVFREAGIARRVERVFIRPQKRQRKHSHYSGKHLRITDRADFSDQ